MLEVLGLLLSRIQGIMPTSGVIFHGHEVAVIKVRLKPGLPVAKDLIDTVMRIQLGEVTPALLINEHCHICEFRQQCHAQAVKDDNLSLLRGLKEKEVRRYSRKGLFTLTQLAHTFRPRRKGKRTERRSQHRYHALQAMAIRDHRVYVLGAPQVPSGPVRIFWDAEGNPEEGFVYLIGMIVCDDTGEHRHSFWADAKDQESDIFDQFVAIVSRYDNPIVFCYGSYERAFVKRMLRLTRHKKLVEKLMETQVNTLTIIYSHFYFPTYSNGLKDIGACLGCMWSDEEASGLQSILWRMRWEKTRDNLWKTKLIEYNLEDCAALLTVTNFLHAACVAPAMCLEPTPSVLPCPSDSVFPQVTRVHELDKLAYAGKWGDISFVHSELNFVNSCAYFDYQRQRVFIRTSKTLKKNLRRSELHCNRRLRISRRIEIIVKKCPACGSTDLSKVAKGGQLDIPRPRVKRAFDLVITPGGMKRRVIEFRTAAYRCNHCGRNMVPDRYNRIAKHFHGLMSWVIYQHVAHRTSGGTITELLREFFSLQVGTEELHMFKSLMARYYRTTTDSLLKKILSGPVLHIDETQVKLKTGKGYVWVFTSTEEVVFMYRQTREGGFLRDMLKDFRGVLVSDFFAAYDSIDCPQQKCLIHLIRDMNQDLLNNPFDEELQLVTQPFASLLRSIVTTIDEHGLKQKHLIRHAGEVDKFFNILSSQAFRSETAQTLRERLIKNRNKLFTFIYHDGVPWNNNNAENAIKKFAYYRENTVGALKEQGLIDYLLLLGIYQTCRYKGVSFLKFLLSRERDIDRFCMGVRSRRRPSAIEVYPKGFVPPHLARVRQKKPTKPTDDFLTIGSD
jgi:predicted RecB family nuclease